MTALPHVTLEPLSPATRARCATLAVHDDQRRFVAPVADYLAACDAEGVWTPLAVCRDGEVVARRPVSSAGGTTRPRR